MTPALESALALANTPSKRAVHSLAPLNAEFATWTFDDVARVVFSAHYTLPRDPRRECVIAFRNVQEHRGRDGHHVHVEVSLEHFHAKRTSLAVGSLVLTREQSVALARELLIGTDYVLAQAVQP